MYGVGGCGGGGGGGWHCERNLIKRSLLSGISGVQLLLESLGILIIILILRSNPFKHSLQIQPPLIAPGRFDISRERRLRFTAKHSILMTLTAN